MKNIHVLPTDKPSSGYVLGKCIKELSDVKIGEFTRTYNLMFSNEYFQAQNIYITSDEEIKERDWCINANNRIVRALNDERDFNPLLKIILTTDDDLIKDGVQAIDDEFLKWFVENPSCEEVEVILNEVSYFIEDNIYKIIIPNDFTIKTRVSTVEYSEHTKKVVEEHNLMYDKVIEFINNNIEEFDKALELHRRKKDIINMMKSDEELGLYEQPKNSGKTLADMKCSCMKYAAGSFSANCRNCGLPPRTKNNSMNRVGTFCDKCRQVMCQCKSTQHTPKEEMLVEIKTKLYGKEDMEQAFIEGHNVYRCVTDNTDEAKECFNEWFNKLKK